MSENEKQTLYFKELTRHASYKDYMIKELTSIIADRDIDCDELLMRYRDEIERHGDRTKEISESK